MFAIVDQVATGLNVPVDLLKVFIALLTSFFLSPLYRVFPSRVARNLLSIIIGFSFLYFIIQEWSFFILASVVLPYCLMLATSRPFRMSVVCSFFLLLIVHSYRFINIYSVWRVDCSVYIMLLVTKLTYYAKWLEKKGREQEGQRSLVDYLAYNLYFPGVIAGPTFAYEVYLDFINNKHDISFANIKLMKALQPFFVTIPLAALAVFTLPIFHGRWVLENEFYLNSHFIVKILLLNFVGFFYRLKYYGGWYFAQSAVNLSGLSLSAKGEYDAAVAVSLKFQIQPNPRNKTQYWNASNQEWLKNVVFESLSGYGANAAFFGTFIISAYWHGIYLTYYVGFALWGIIVHINKWVYKWSLAFPKLSNSLPVRIFAFVLGSTLFSYVGMFLSMLDWNDAVAFHSDVYHWGTILLFLGLALSLLVRPPRVDKKQ